MNSMSGFYREGDRHMMNDGGLSTRMKESEVARHVPTHKEKKQAEKER